MAVVSALVSRGQLARERRRESHSRYARIMVAERDTPIALANVLVMRSSDSPFGHFAIVVAITRTWRGAIGLLVCKKFLHRPFHPGVKKPGKARDRRHWCCQTQGHIATDIPVLQAAGGLAVARNAN